MNSEEARLLHPIARFLEEHGWEQASGEWYLAQNSEDPCKSMVVIDKIEDSRDLGTLGELSQMTREQLVARLIERREEDADMLRGRIEEAMIYVQEALREGISPLEMQRNIKQVKDILEGK